MTAIIDPVVLAKSHSPVLAWQLPRAYEPYLGHVQVLSLDCFDTLLWRQTATPRDVFYVMQEKPLCRSLGVTAQQRISAAARAYRSQFIIHGNHQVHISDIYARFTALSSAQQQQLAEEELKTEIELCDAFPPAVELIRRAYAAGLKIIIVSDIYYTESELKKLLAACLPSDVYAMISDVFTSCVQKIAKSDGLFTIVQQKLQVPSQAILHIGDHPIADYAAPKKLGLNALHFLQFEQSVSQFLRLQHSVAALATLAQPDNEEKQAARFSPFRPIFSLMKNTEQTPERMIGYQSFGPILYTFARFVSEELAAMRARGKHPKVFFLLRDAYLLAQACQAYAGESVGKLVRIRKFVTVAASFRSQADVDHYLSSIKPEHFNYWVIAEQLLLPTAVTEKIMQYVHLTPEPEKSFYQVLRKPEVLAVILEQSAAYRERLKKYILKEMQIKPGDSIVLVDTGYAGVTQEFLSRTFQEEMNIEINGLYLMGSHEPDRPDCRSLFTSTWCEHGLFEQSCTYQEGAVIDYDLNGDPIFDNIKLSAQQYAKVMALQQHALDFIRDAKQYFNDVSIALEKMKIAAFSALHRHIFFPTSTEVAYFQSYQHDKDMGHDGRKTMYHLEQAQNTLQQKCHLTKLHPYDARTINLNLTLSSLLQRSFNLELDQEPISFQTEIVKLVFIQGANVQQIDAYAMPTWNGYYSLYTPLIQSEQVGVLFGLNYEFVQIEAVTLVGLTASSNIDEHLTIDQMTAKNDGLFECTEKGLLILSPFTQTHEPYRYQIIFRPIVKRLTQLT